MGKDCAYVNVPMEFDVMIAEVGVEVDQIKGNCICGKY